MNLSLNQTLLNSGNYSVTDSLPLIRMDSVTHVHGLAVYVKEGLPFAWDVSLENSTDSGVFDWLYFFLFFFFFYLGFLSRIFTIHETAGEGRGYLFNSSLPLPLASQTLRH